MLNDRFPKQAAEQFKLISNWRRIELEHHVPQVERDPYHVHPSIEINYLQGCDMTYSFGGLPVLVPEGCFCIFWAAQAHRVLAVSGPGKITNAYISLEEFWSWSLPQAFLNALLGGAVIAANGRMPGDDALAERWASEIGSTSGYIDTIHCLELQARMTRLAAGDWRTLSPATDHTRAARLGGTAIVHFDRMLRFISENFAEPITLADVAEATSISKNHANALFKSIMGTTIKAHITNVRIYRAKMLLAETDDKIISVAHDCGFRSLSSFYEAFQRRNEISPAGFRSKLVR